jgi:hypothetical protein
VLRDLRLSSQGVRLDLLRIGQRLLRLFARATAEQFRAAPAMLPTMGMELSLSANPR